MTRLRPVTAADVPFLERQHEDEEASGEHNWFGHRALGRLAEQVESGQTIRPDGGVMAVINEDDQIVGDVSWRTALNGPPPNGECWEIGIWIAPDARGHGHGTSAQRQLTDYLFAHTMRERVQAGTESDNVGEQKALEKAGFTREGVLRRSCFRGGEWRDMVVYSKLRHE